MERYEFYKKRLKNMLSEKRFMHCINVSQTAAKLAENYGVNVENARIAGLLHDVCKEMPDNILIEILRKNRFEGVNRVSPKVRHGFAGYFFLKNDWKISNYDILNGVKYHTVGRKGMSLFEKIIFVADYISPERPWDDIDELTEMAFVDINRVALKKVSTYIISCIKRHQLVHTYTVDFYNDIIAKGDKK